MKIKKSVIKVLEGERAHQERKWGQRRHTPGEWILIMEKCLADAKHALVATDGKYRSQHEIRQVTAVGIAALEQCGAPRRDEKINLKKF